MTTFNRKNRRYRIAVWCTDCAFWWDRNREGFYGGFTLGCFFVLFATYLALGV